MSKQSRIQFFDDALRRLRKASQQGFYSLQSQAFLELTGFQQSYPNIPLQRNLHFSYNQIHAYSQSIWPRDTSKALVPLKSKGDGNCLYRSVSLLCSGSEDYHLEFRARTVCELVLNSSFYLVEDKCSILSIKGATPIKNVLAATSRSLHSFLQMSVVFHNYASRKTVYTHVLQILMQTCGKFMVFHPLLAFQCNLFTLSIIKDTDQHLTF